MQAPNVNPYLSGMARATWMLFATVGRVMPVSEVIEGNYMTEGRDAIRNAMTELKRFGDIKAVKEQTSNGRWVTSLKFTEVGQKYVDLFNWNYLPVPTPEIPTVGEPGTTSSIDNNYSRLEVLRTSNLSGAPNSEEIIKMGWNLDGEENDEVALKATRKAKLAKDDEAVGAIGKVEDRQKKLKAKYKTTSFEAVPASMRRYERPEEDWTTDDLIAEFYDKIREHSAGVPAQVNGKSLITWINKTVGEGVSRHAILKGIRMFFDDPRNLNDLGVGQPIWRRFIAYFPTVVGLTSTKSVEYVDDEFKSHQDKMLKLLGGN